MAAVITMRGHLLKGIFTRMLYSDVYMTQKDDWGFCEGKHTDSLC